MRVAVLGAGRAGSSVAAHLALEGHQVRMSPGAGEDADALRQAQAVGITGLLGDRSVPLELVSDDLATVVADAELVALSVEPSQQAAWLQRVPPFVSPEQALWLCQGAAASLLARRQGAPDRWPLLIETLAVPYSARWGGPGRVALRSFVTVPAAAFPARRNREALDLLSAFYKLTEARNVLELALQNVNALVHPVPTLLNWGWIEAREGEFSVYGEGMTRGVVACLDALDEERMQVCRALGVSDASIDELYARLQVKPLFRQQLGRNAMGLGNLERYEDRFVVDDVGEALVTIASLGKQFGIGTPVADAIIHLCGKLYATDFSKAGRTTRALGIEGLSAVEIDHLLLEGA